MTVRGAPLRGALMVCGATSDAGKTTVVAGLCRLLARRGVRVAPFKAQNMSLNSTVTASGHEIARAQWFQAVAAGATPEAAMNPVLLKPTSETGSQVVVDGAPVASMEAAAYHESKLELLGLVLDRLADLRRRYDVVICEGAGSPAEINLLDRDIVNLRVAVEAGMRSIVVGDIDPGGVFATLYGTVALLPPEQRATVGGFVINKMRGDPGLLLDGPARLHELTGVPVLGVIPWIADTGLDAEDSMALERPRHRTRPALADELDVAVVRFPQTSNATDVDPLLVEAGVRVRWVHDRAGLGDPDLVVLPGSKTTVSDLAWLRRCGLADAVARTEAIVLGICGGYQMLGERIDDGVESVTPTAPGLGLLPVTTRFADPKVTRRRTGRALGHEVEGYQIHRGRVTPHGGEPFVALDGDGTGPATLDGVHDGHRFGTTLHGLLECDALRRDLLERAAHRRRKTWRGDGVRYAERREQAIDAVADMLAAHLDLRAVDELITEATPVTGR